MDAPKLILFDCDGTLVDSQFMIARSMEAAFHDHQMEPPPLSTVLNIVGLSLGDAMARLAPEAKPALQQALADTYARTFRHLREAGEREPLYPGARDALETLADTGYLMGVATGKSRRGLNAVMAHHGLERFFVTLQTADFGPGKPHPAMVERALAETGVAAHDTVVVGDTSYDMEMARAAKAAAVGVAWGYHAPEVLEASGASVVLRDFHNLAGVVERILKKRAA